jgi:copper chaperone NosL
MIKLLNLYIAIFSLIILTSCSTDPANIAFGHDQCDFCKMNIVDPMHAAQYVTAKGKQFKFDAIECLVAKLDEREDMELAVIRVSDYSDKGKMIDAENAFYLISSKLKSPMGAGLSAFSTEEKAMEAQEEYTGDLYDWQALQSELGNKAP